MFSRRIGLMGLAAICVLPLVSGVTTARADQPKPVEKKDEKKAATPSFKQAWTVEVPDDAIQVGLADVMGDKKSHLLVLGKNGILTIHDVNSETPKEVGKVELGKNVTSFVAGSFLKDKPAIIAINGAFFVRGKDDAYSKKENAELVPVSGQLMPLTETATLLTFAADEPKEFRFTEKDGQIIVEGKMPEDPIKKPDFYRLATVRFPKELPEQVPIPDGWKMAGMNILFEKGAAKPKMLTLQVEGDKQRLAVYDMANDNVPPDQAEPIWTGNWLKGKFLSMAVGVNPKDTKQMGAMVLTEAGESGKKRTATFYTKEW